MHAEEFIVGPNVANSEWFVGPTAIERGDGMRAFAPDRDLDRAIAEVARARALLSRAAVIADPPETFLDLLGKVRRTLTQAHRRTRPAETWLAEHAEVPEVLDGCPETASLAWKLEEMYRPAAHDCAYRLSLVAPAQVRLDLLRKTLDGPCGGSRAIRAERQAARRLAGFAVEKPGDLPLLDRIDPQHALRRQLAHARAALLDGQPARLQLYDDSGGLPLAFVRLQPLRPGLGEAAFSCDNRHWNDLRSGPLHADRLDPVSLLQPFLGRDARAPCAPSCGGSPSLPELAALPARGMS